MANTVDPQTEEDWLSCIPLPEYLVKIPLGHLSYVTGEEVYIDGNGEYWSPADYKAKYNLDPAVVWAAVQKYRAAFTSKLGEKKA